MATLTSLGLNIFARNQASRVLRQVSGDVDGMAGRMVAAGDSIAGVGARLTTRVTAPIVGVGTAAFKMASDFETSTTRMTALAGVQQDQVAEWEDDIRSLARTYGTSATEASDALFFIVSAGLEGAGAMDALEVSLKGSAAGLGEVEEIASFATSAILGYGEDVLDAAQATDILAAAAAEATFAPEEMGAALTGVIPIAAEMGVTLDEAAGIMAALGPSTNSAAEAGTRMSAMMRSLIAPSSQAQTILEDVGLSGDQLRSVIEEDGLLAGLRLLEDSLDGDTEAMSRVLGSSEALQGALGLLGQDADEVDAIMGNVADSSGTLDRAFDEVADTAAFQMRRAIAENKDVLLELGQNLLPLVTEALSTIADRVSGAAERWDGLSDRTQQFILRAAGIAAALGPGLVVLGRVIRLIGTTILLGRGLAAFSSALWLGNAALTAKSGAAARAGAALHGFAAALGRGIAATLFWTRVLGLLALEYLKAAGRAIAARAAVIAQAVAQRAAAAATRIWTGAQWLLNAALTANPVGIVIMAIVALIAIIVVAWRRSERFRAVVTGAWSGIKDIAAAVVAWFQDTALPVLRRVWDRIVEALQPVRDWLGRVRDSAADLIAWLRDLPGRISAAWDRLVGLVRDPPTFSEVLERLREVGARIAAWLRGRGEAFAEWIRDLPRRIAEGGQALGRAFLGLLASILDRDRLREIGEGIAEWIRGLAGRIRERLGEAAAAFVDWVRDLPGRIVARLREVGESIADWARGIPDRIREAVDSGRLAQWVADMKERAQERLGEIVDAVVEWARGLPDKIRDAIGRGEELVDKLKEWAPQILKGLGIALLVVAFGIPALLLGLIAAVAFVIFVVVDELTRDLRAQFAEMMSDLAQRAMDGVGSIVGWFKSLPGRVGRWLAELWRSAVGWFQSLWRRIVGGSIIPDLVNGVIAWFRRLLSRAVALAVAIYQGIVARVQALRDGVLARIRALRDRAVETLTRLRDRGQQLFTDLHDWLISRAERLRDRVVSAVRSLRDRVIAAFERAKSGVEKAWEKLRDVASKPVKFVIDTVYNQGIRKLWNLVADKVDGIGELDRMPMPRGLARGGVLPGDSSFRDGDSLLVPMRPGEGVYVSEAMRDPFERARLAAINSAAMGGGQAAMDRVRAQLDFGGNPRTRPATGRAQLGFDTGGILGRVTSALGSAWNSIVGKLKDWATKPLNSMRDGLAARFGRGDDFSGIPYHAFRHWQDKILARMKTEDEAEAGGAASFGSLDNVSAGMRRAASFVSKTVGRAYQWGGGGPRFDCSGWMAGIQNAIMNRNPPSHFGRLYSTHSFMGGGPAGWVRNLNSRFMVGVRHGGRASAHMSGSLRPGSRRVAVESRGSRGTVMGRSARAHNHPMYPHRFGFAPVADRGAVLAPGLNLLDNRTGRAEPLTRADLRKQEEPTRVILELQSDDEEQLRRLRRTVRTQGGDVQVVLGHRRRGGR